MEFSMTGVESRLIWECNNIELAWVCLSVRGLGLQLVQIYHSYPLGINVALLLCRWRREHPWWIHILSGSYLLLQAVQWGPSLSGKGPWPRGKEPLFSRGCLSKVLSFSILAFIVFFLCRRWRGEGAVGNVVEAKVFSSFSLSLRLELLSLRK